MWIISFIEDQEVIKIILKQLGLWIVERKLTPKAHGPLPATNHLRALRSRRLEKIDSAVLPRRQLCYI